MPPATTCCGPPDDGLAEPKDIRFGDNLPKTRSGKIMRRLLRSIAKGEAITQQAWTLENPAILAQLRARVCHRFIHRF